MKRFSPGERIEVREVWNGRAWEIRRPIVVEDAPNVIAVYNAPGSPIRVAAGPDGKRLRLPPPKWSMADASIPSDRRILGLHPPGSDHSVHVVWDESWRLLYWYINLEQDRLRNTRGFDYEEYVLDLVVQPDMESWRWKDEDELAEAVERGLFTPEQAASFRAEGERAVEWLLARRPPYDRPWEDWRPPSDWP
ncbi:MAG: DUF402 domain-containing protein [Chloroflexi bacterium]|nr:DUF402 domain-containing protein [Chloroflexota bacterium]